MSHFRQDQRFSVTLEFRAWGLEFRAWGLEFRVWGLGSGDKMIVTKGFSVRFL